MASPSGRRRGPSTTGRDTAFSRFITRIHLTVAGVVVVVGAVLAWIVARWLGSRALFLMVYAGVLVLAISYFVARRRLQIEVDRSSLPARMREGQTNEVTLRIKAGRRATTLVVEEELHPSMGRTVRIPVASIAGGQELEHTYTFSPTRRGVFEIGPTTATWSDPFGLTTQRQQLAGTTQLIVHPSTELVRDRILTRMWEDPPIRPPISKPWPTGFEFYGMRDYVPGDDMRRVVWAAVAKTGRMLVRESEQGITDRVSMILDTDREWHKPGDPSDTFEMAVRAVASIGVRHLDDGFSLSVSAGGVRLARDLRGPRARYELLDQLARVDMDKTSLTTVGPLLAEDGRRGSHFVIVTPHHDKGMASQLRLVVERGNSVVIVKIVWDESDPQSLARAASLGCQVVQLPLQSSIEAAFEHQVGAGMSR